MWPSLRQAASGTAGDGDGTHPVDDAFGDGKNQTYAWVKKNKNILGDHPLNNISTSWKSKLQIA